MPQSLWPLIFFGCLIPSLIRSQPVDTIWEDLSPHRSAFLKVNGVKLHFLDWGGHGQPVLLLHGLGDTAHIFDDLAPGLTGSFHVIGLTRRGHGQSEKPETGYDTATLVEDIRQFLDALKIDRVILIGHSLAGDEMTRFATVHPQRVIKLVYLDAAYDRARIKETLAKMPPELSQAKADLLSLDTFRQWVSRISFWSPAWEANAREMMRLSPDLKIVGEVKPAKVSRLLIEGTQQSKPDYKRVRAPALNLAATGVSSKVTNLVHALPAPRREAVEDYLRHVNNLKALQIERFRNEIPNGTVIELTDTDHHCFIQRQVEVIEHIHKFLAH